MKIVTTIILFLYFTIYCNAQLNKNPHQQITRRSLDSFVYHVPLHHSPKFKMTFKSSLNRSLFKEIINDPELIDEVLISQLVRYNIRFRCRLKTQNRIFIGFESMASSNITGTIYTGFRRYF
jgi:hypothetical protein